MPTPEVNNSQVSIERITIARRVLSCCKSKQQPELRDIEQLRRWANFEDLDLSMELMAYRIIDIESQKKPAELALSIASRDHA